MKVRREAALQTTQVREGFFHLAHRQALDLEPRFQMIGVKIFPGAIRRPQKLPDGRSRYQKPRQPPRAAEKDQRGISSRIG
jgi:hypothetical protein